MALPANPDWKLNPEGAVPLHKQFEDRIIHKIRTGEWKPGQRIPSERDLMQMANISRTTVRQALETLVHQSFLERIHGRGTFVKPPRLEQPLNIVYSFSEQLRALGVQLQDKVLTLELVPASTELAERLNVDVGEDVIYLHRVRYLKGTPLMVNLAYLPYTLCPGLLGAQFDSSLYRLLSERFDLPITRAVDRFEATSADSTLADQLQIPRRAPLMYVERTAWTKNDQVVHVGYNYIRGDMCRFRSDLDSSHTARLELKRAEVTPNYTTT